MGKYTNIQMDKRKTDKQTYGQTNKLTYKQVDKKANEHIVL